MNNLTMKEFSCLIKSANDLTDMYRWCGVANIIGGTCGNCDCCRLLVGKVDLLENKRPRNICIRYMKLGAIR